MKVKAYFVAILGSVLFFSSLGIWSISEAQKKPDKKEGKGDAVRVIEETGPLGHKTIGIDESSIVQDPSKELLLTYSALMTWQYDTKSNPPPPGGIKKLDGRKVRITGFMFPLQEGTSIQNFCLLRTTQTCCYGPRPQYNQYIFVEMAKPTAFHRLDPVTCVGKLKVEPTPEEGFIYRMEGEICESVSAKEN
jgi:hypothetical protein